METTRDSKKATQMTERELSEMLVTETRDKHSESKTSFRWREPMAAVLVAILFNWTIYHGEGFAGVGAFLVGSALLMWCGSARRCWRISTSIVTVLLLCIATRLVWYGDGLVTTCGLWLIVALAMTFAGEIPYIPDLFTWWVQMLPAGIVSSIASSSSIVQTERSGSRMPALRSIAAILLPVLAVAVFGSIFVKANPDLAEWFHSNWQHFLDTIWERFADWLPSTLQVFLWIFVGLVTLGLLRPLIRGSLTKSLEEYEAQPRKTDSPVAAAPLWSAYRNTLIAVSILFVTYLVFEFRTLWGRNFPQGFYYAGYAHEGAAWLTIALALATVVLSVIFRGAILDDERLPRLKRLAWIWSALNLLLAAAVYHRLAIYIEFNGMTRMRMVGLFGVSTVVVGFLLVILKIARQHGFVWLIQRQLWVPSLAIVLYGITPVDWLVHSWNTWQIMSNHPAASVQITEHEVDSQGILALCPLADAPDPIIRDGIRALLAERAGRLKQERNGRTDNRQHSTEWTAYQHVDHALRTRLEELQPKWSQYQDKGRRDAAGVRFRTYAYRWY